MQTSDTIYVIVSRPLHPHLEWVEPTAWKPRAWLPSLEEAWAELDLLKEQEREDLHTHEDDEPHLHEREYDVWTVPGVTF